METQGSRLYSLAEIYHFDYLALRSVGSLRRAKRSGQVDSAFIERLMLAVTEVNKCALCSYAHTKMALDIGMDKKDVSDMLKGEFGSVPEAEADAILFAQYYADSRSRCTAEAWNKIVDEYGAAKALGILGAIRMIMVGNVYGIAYGSFAHRFKGHADPRSNIIYELVVIICGTLLFPVAMIQALLAALLRMPVAKFD